MAPSFDPRSIASYAPAMVETTTRFVEKWRELTPNTVVDIDSEMRKLTLQIISRTMFSSDSNDICELVGKTLREGTEAMDFGLLDALPLIGPWRMPEKWLISTRFSAPWTPRSSSSSMRGLPRLRKPDSGLVGRWSPRAILNRAPADYTGSSRRGGDYFHRRTRNHRRSHDLCLVSARKTSLGGGEASPGTCRSTGRTTAYGMRISSACLTRDR